ILDHAKRGKTIVFTEMQREADALALSMGQKFKCKALQGDYTRESTLSLFRDGTFDLLFATDDVARGVDVPIVELVSVRCYPDLR
ncbi:hypothetical protein MKW98_025382, partial [Papaver atlanticum]